MESSSSSSSFSILNVGVLKRFTASPVVVVVQRQSDVVSGMRKIYGDSIVVAFTGENGGAEVEGLIPVILSLSKTFY